MKILVSPGFPTLPNQTAIYLRHFFSLHIGIYTTSIAIGYITRRPGSRSAIELSNFKTYRRVRFSFHAAFSHSVNLFKFYLCIKNANSPPSWHFHGMLGPVYSDQLSVLIFSTYRFFYQDNSLLKKSYPCDVVGCSKQFSTPYRLKAHIRSHTGDMFECESQGCDKAFITQSDLNKHFKTHSGMKPFHCAHTGCDKVYTTAHHLKVHVLYSNYCHRLGNK